MGAAPTPDAAFAFDDFDDDVDVDVVGSSQPDSEPEATPEFETAVERALRGLSTKAGATEGFLASFDRTAALYREPGPFAAMAQGELDAPLLEARRRAYTGSREGPSFR